jgi:hypothetical protein
MLVFWRQGLVFLATPKTGSTAIESVLAPHAAVVITRPPQLKHANMQKYQRQLAPFLGDPGLEKLSTCALMREPLDWLGSWYRYRQRPEEVPDKSTLGMSFDEFVLAWCRKDQPECARVGAQATFLTPEGLRPVDHIFRYEDMPAFLRFLERRLGMPVVLPVENVSPEAELSLSADVAARLKTHAARDFALYASLSA